MVDDIESGKVEAIPMTLEELDEIDNFVGDMIDTVDLDVTEEE